MCTTCHPLCKKGEPYTHIFGDVKKQRKNNPERNKAMTSRGNKQRMGRHRDESQTSVKGPGRELLEVVFRTQHARGQGRKSLPGVLALAGADLC